MIACPACHTFNSDGEEVCLSCRSPLAAPAAAGDGPPGGEAAASSRAARCPNGHPVNPSWKSCPYCTHGGAAANGSSPTRLEPRQRAEGPAARRTRLPGAAGPTTAPPPAGGSPQRPTRLEEAPAPARSHQRTVLRPAAGRPPSPPSDPAGVERSAAHSAEPPGAPVAPPGRAAGDLGDGRPLVGVLAAPAATPQGLLFPLRPGRNRIGCDPQCEIHLGHDPQVSGEHALILHRGGSFYLNDRMSTNGTFVNGGEVDPSTQATLLGDRDRIQCGDTELILLRLDQDASEG